MVRTRIHIRTVGKVPIIDVHRRIGHPADFPIERDAAVSALARKLPAFISQQYSEDITDYLVRGIARITEDELKRIVEHGLDRYLEDFEGMYDPPQVGEIYSLTRIAWAYPIDKKDPYYPINNAVGHAAEERKQKYGLDSSNDPIGLLLLRRREAVRISHNYYGFPNPSAALGAISLLHF